MVRLGLLLYLLLLAPKAQSTPTITDSLVLVIKKAETDSIKVMAIGNLARYYAPFNNHKAEHNYLKAIHFCDSLLNINSKVFYEKEKASLQSSLGVTYYMTANYPKALKAEMAAIQGFVKYGIKEKLGRCYVVIGAIYKEQNQPKKALVFHEKALLLHKKNNDSTGIALALNNLGVTYFELKQDQKAQHFYQNALQIYQSLNDKRGMSVELLNLGSACKQLGKIDSAIYHF